MAVTYYKRFRMEIDLDSNLAVPSLPNGHYWIAWNESLLGVHAEVKYRSFHQELDSRVFPCLGDRYGCLRLMREIRRKHGFLPQSTWLIGYKQDVCGRVQGIIDLDNMGVIQNLGVVSEHRRKNIGRALLMKALNGFRQSGAIRARLEVTAENSGAIKLYRDVGFRRAKTLFKAAD